jgi:hypothetical protein
VFGLDAPAAPMVERLRGLVSDRRWPGGLTQIESTVPVQVALKRKTLV